MSPVLHLLAGPNGAGKTTFVTRVLQPTTNLPFVNADVIAAERWPEDPTSHGHDASRVAAEERARLIAAGESFISETVFSHPSKNALVQAARSSGFIVTLHVIVLPVEVSVARVSERVRRGGHPVPEEKIRARYERLWPLVATAARDADEAVFYDNSTAATPFRKVARLTNGHLAGTPAWPAWTPDALADLT